MIGRGWQILERFALPLDFLAVAPQGEDGRQAKGKHDSEPCTLGHLDKHRGEVGTVDGRGR